MRVWVDPLVLKQVNTMYDKYWTQYRVNTQKWFYWSQNMQDFMLYWARVKTFSPISLFDPILGSHKRTSAPVRPVPESSNSTFVLWLGFMHLLLIGLYPYFIYKCLLSAKVDISRAVKEGFPSDLVLFCLLIKKRNTNF